MPFRQEKALESTEGTPYEGFTSVQWALEFIERYGQIDGDHHKAWVLDQVARVLHGTPVILSLASWTNEAGEIVDSEYRFETGEPSEAYLGWVYDLKRGSAAEGEDDEYGYDEGVAP